MFYRFLSIVLSFVLLVQSAVAAPLASRLDSFPEWNQKPPVKVAQGDLHYPQWISGTWEAESTLVEQIAPLAPEIVSPGFEDNQQYIDLPVKFLVRFGAEYYTPEKRLFVPQLKLNNNRQNPVVADRVFNGEHIAAAYLGNKNVLKVKVDPDNPNKQITFLQGDRKLISTVTGRATETPNSNRFIATEVTKQLFRSPERIYLNEVETTSDYQLIESENIQARQITAIYLSPQDPDYFTAGDRPVAIYRYQLNLKKQQMKDES